VSSVVSTEVGYRIGRRQRSSAKAPPESHVGAIQAALLGILALLLGFTFSLALQRYDSRSEAVVDEANAIGTAILRSELLPTSIAGEARTVLLDYLDGRVRESTIPLANRAERQALLMKAEQDQATLWRLALAAAEEDRSEITSGLFVESLNELIDSYGRRNAALDRHVPEGVMLLLYGAFLLTWGIVGYTAGTSGYRPSLVAYLMLVFVLIVVFVVVDLDRPRRGLVQIDHTSLTELQAAQNADQSSSQPTSEETVTTSTPAKPDYVASLEAAYGAPSQAGFGSAVFFEPMQAGDGLGQAALTKYRYFVGELWERYGEDAWIEPWKEVYARPAGAKPDIVAELRGIEDADAANSAPMVLDVVEDAALARAALAAAFDDPAVTELRVFNLGDGGAMSGILVAGRRGDSDEATFLVFLLD
jgi:hypothetical protein